MLLGLGRCALSSLPPYLALGAAMNRRVVHSDPEILGGTPVFVKSEISGHEGRYVREMGWSGLKNGELLRRAAGRLTCS